MTEFPRTFSFVTFFSVSLNFAALAVLLWARGMSLAAEATWLRSWSGEAPPILGLSVGFFINLSNRFEFGATCRALDLGLGASAAEVGRPEGAGTSSCSSSPT